MRRFYLENEKGKRCDCQKEFLLTGPDGLGIDYELSYTQIGNKFIKDYMNTEQGVIRATANFLKPNQYAKFQKFSDFVHSAKQLYLIYVPDETTGTEYRRDADIESIDKGEIDQQGILSIPLQFRCKTLYYTKNQQRFIVEKRDGEMRYSFRWPAVFTSYKERGTTINNDGHVEAGFEAEINGYVENPIIEIWQDKKMVHSVQFDLIVKEEEKILYSTKDDDLYIIHQKKDGTQENILNLMDIEKENFFKVPIGQSDVKFTSDTGVMTKIYLATYIFYQTR